MEVCLRVVMLRSERGKVRLWTTFWVSVREASADPIAIAPTPPGPAVVRVASVGCVGTSHLVTVREGRRLVRPSCPRR
jgi:hypothetical protein